MKQRCMRCTACGARPAVSTGAFASTPIPVRFCYVCGSSLQSPLSEEEIEESNNYININKNNNNSGMFTTPIHTDTGDVAEIQFSSTLVKRNPFSVQELLKKLWEKLRLWGSDTLINCLPCSTVHNNERITNLTVHREEEEERSPPLFYAWPLELNSPMEEENKKIEFITEDNTPSPSLFVQLQIIYKVFAEVVLEYNKVVSSLQMRCINESEMWRKYTSRLKNELRQRNEERVALIKRVSHLERELSLQNERHKREFQEERSKRDDKHKWSLNMEQQQQESLGEAYRFLRDTLIHGKHNTH